MKPQNEYEIFYCPLTKEDLHPARKEVLKNVNSQLPEGQNVFENGLVNSSQTVFYPIVHDILHLLPFYSIPLTSAASSLNQMEADKERIFNYYNSISFCEFAGQQVFSDAEQFVDFRSFLLPYNEHGYSASKRYLPHSGKYFIDVGCGPVAFKEYVQLAEGYETRICIDLSVNVLRQAKSNLAKYEQKAIFVCGDITQLPLKDNIADAVVCQHVLFHVQRHLQKTALQELVRIARPGRKIAIVYDWFYHSWLMNIFLGPVQLYRVARHFAGKLYSKWFRRNSLYFFSHGPQWFYKNNPGTQIQIRVWRSINIWFSRIYLHKNLFGKNLIAYIRKLEEKYPERMGRLGEYPIILIEK